MCMFFNGMNQGETLEKFLDRVVRPDPEYIKDCKEVIDSVVRRIEEQKHLKYSVNHLIIGGSLGKGTAVRNHSDVDILVVLNGFRNLEDLVENMEDVIKSFKDYMHSTGDHSTKILKETPFALQFQVFCSIKRVWIDVDLLPIVDIFSTDTPWEDIYTTMYRKQYLRKYYAKCVAKLQIHFVKSVPPKVKDLIRLLKYWNYTENEAIMSSYSLELLVIYVWRQHGKPDNFTMKKMIKDVVDLLEAFGTVKVSFNDHYIAAKYIRMLKRTPPFILDPANPFHNVAKEGWSEQLNLEQIHGECVQSGKYQGRREQSVESFLGDTMHSENFSTTINSIEGKGAILKGKYNSLPEESEGMGTLKKYNSLPEESEGMGTWLKVAIVGFVLTMVFVKLMSDNKKN